MKRLLRLVVPVFMAAAAQAQTTTDGLMMPKNNFCTGFMGTYDKWTDYWEGSLKRENGNIGSITTTSVMWFGNYGVSDKLNILASVPFVMTKASAGTMHGMQGIQDLMVNVKYKFLRKPIDSAVFSAFVVGGLGTPLTNYSPDFLPLSIGMASKQANVRLNLNYFTKMKLYVNGSVGYTFRSNVELDRESYYSDGEIYFTNQVDMPNVLDFSFSVGYINRGLETKLSYIQQNTQGGGDIRRQDMPFVSNQMNFSKVEALAMYYLPKPKYFAVRGAYSYTVAGRNVGQSSTVLAGLLYTFHFSKSK
jgi:hypothetical protein